LSPITGARCRVTRLRDLVEARRLGVVHGDRDRHFVPRLIGIARAKGISAYVGDGAQRWPMVHVRDAAEAYRLTLERGKAGACHHAIALGWQPRERGLLEDLEKGTYFDH
jgi:nucleoside-diphosphate-sugar epimerase